MRHATQPPWGPVAPTPTQWLNWFHENDYDGQLEIAEWAIRFSEESTNCLIKHQRWEAVR